jgi:methionine sulfoxide reductase heme-binding subunit
MSSPLGIISNLLALNSVQIWWYVTRSAGLVAYLLLWLSTAWGLAVSSRIFDPYLQRNYTYDFHQFISLLAIGFLGLHLTVLLLDHYLPFSVSQILVPFTSTYRPLWVGIGAITFYLTMVVTITFYIRHRIGVRLFRVIHVFSLVAFVGAALHGYFSGTDTPLLSVKLMYQLTFLSVVFLMAFWLISLLQGKMNATRASQVQPISRQ